MSTDLSDLLLAKKRFGCLFADPPWPEQGGGRIKRGADRHYPLMEIPEIIAMGEVVQQLAKTDSHLYLWATNNFLPDALSVMEAWCFRYVTVITWMKTGNIGLGQYYRGITEQILFGVRGKHRGYRKLRNGKKAMGRTGFLEARPGRHSQKPDYPYEWARKVSYGPYLEMFAIGDRPGWEVWGNQIWKK